MTSETMLVPGTNEPFESMLHRETINQVSILQSLSQGDFLGSITVGELKSLGDTGIGTFDCLDGELIMLNGQVYKARGNGKVYVAKDDETVPFADVTFMDDDISFEVANVESLAALSKELGAKADLANPNMFYVVTIDCQLESLKVRSAIRRYSEEEADESLAEYMKDAEVSFDYEDVTGTIVALYCPPFMASLNMPGWHYHFLSDDTTIGGHILALSMTRGSVTMDQTRSFNMILPDADSKFSNMDLTIDQSADLKKVEADKS